MGPKRKYEKKPTTSPKGKNSSRARSISPKAGGGSGKKNENSTGKSLPPPSGYLISCDIPTKQFILSMNQTKGPDKQFVLEDLDAEHLLVKESARTEIEREVERWMDENVFSAIERVGENLDMS